MIATYHSIVSSIRLDFALYVSYLTPSTWMRIKAFYSYGRFFHHIFLLDICWLLSSFFTCYPFSPDLPHIVRQIVRSKSSINLIDSGQLMFIMWWKKKIGSIGYGNQILTLPAEQRCQIRQNVLHKNTSGASSFLSIFFFLFHSPLAPITINEWKNTYAACIEKRPIQKY